MIFICNISRERKRGVDDCHKIVSNSYNIDGSHHVLTLMNLTPNPLPSISHYQILLCFCPNSLFQKHLPLKC